MIEKRSGIDTDRRLANAFRQAMAYLGELKAAGVPQQDRIAALERILRANWPALPPEHLWPWWARAPRCIKCDGTGLEMRTVTNRLGCVVEEGSPCACPAGAKFGPKPVSATPGHSTAGQVSPAKPSKGFTRW